MHNEAIARTKTEQEIKIEQSQKEARKLILERDELVGKLKSTLETLQNITIGTELATDDGNEGLSQNIQHILDLRKACGELTEAVEKTEEELRKISFKIQGSRAASPGSVRNN